MNRTASGGGKPVPACRAHSPEIWFPLGYTAEANLSQIVVAKAICAGCPIRIGCLEFALEVKEEHGIWGGLTPKERRGMRGVEGGRDELLRAMVSA
jgi:hypothetical protein